MENQNDQALAVATKGLVEFGSIKEMQDFATELVKTGLTPIKNAGGVVAAILYGKELGLPPMVSVNHIHPIGGRATLGVHLINSLLQKEGIVIETIRDYEPCVDFVMKGDDDKAVLVDKTTGAIVERIEGKAPANSTPVFLRQGFVDEEPKNHEVKGKRITNYRTVLRFTRLLKRPDGTFVETTQTSNFSYGDAVAAELTSNPVWMKYPRTQCWNRALALGGRMIADDVLLGAMETSEYADVHKIKYDVREGKVVFEEAEAVDVTPVTNQTSEEVVKEESSSTEVNNQNSSQNN